MASVWKPSREDIAEAILSVGSKRGVGCDIVPVELLKCSPASARILEPLFAKISAQTLLPHAWRGCLEVTVPKSKGSAEKRGVGLVNHTAKVFFNALRQRLNPALEEAALPTQMGRLRARSADRASHLSRSMWRRATAKGKSAYALFVDVVAAFYSLPLELAFGFFGSAESLAECLAKSRVPATYCLVLVSRVMAGDTSFARGGVSPHIEALVQEAHRETLVAVDYDEHCATTKTGSIPGHSLADLAFNFVMLDALQEVSGRLRVEGLIDSVEWYPDAGPFGAPGGQIERLEVLPLAFMDDIHAFSSHGSADRAARALAKTTELYSEVLESFGLLVTWKPGTTEAMLALRNKGAAAAATHLKRVEGATYFPLEGIQGHGLRIVSHYKHLGIVSAKSSSMHLEATRRANAATAVYMPLARTVFGNQGIVRSTRQALAGSLVFSVLLTGAGTLPQLTAASAGKIRAVFMWVQRMLLGISARQQVLRPTWRSCVSLVRQVLLSSCAKLVSCMFRIWCAWNSHYWPLGQSLGS